MLDLGVRPMGRAELMASLGLLSYMEPLTEDLMRERAAYDLEHDDYDSPHSRAWNVSNHASMWPGDASDACARLLVYSMMNIPTAEGPMPPWVTSTGAVGKAGELDIVEAWFQGGRMLGVPESLDLGPDVKVHQMGFVDRDHWATGSTDLVILRPGSRRPHITEIKGKAHEVIDEMINGRALDVNGTIVYKPRAPDASHVRQLRATVGLAHEHDWGQAVVCEGCWRILYADIFTELVGDRANPHHLVQSAIIEHNLRYCPWCGNEGQVEIDLEPPTTGEIYYWSRSWPRGNPRLGPGTKSFFFEHDPEYMERGRRTLRIVRDSFRAGDLPARNRTFQWGQLPCAQCSYKRVCRLDEGVQPRKRKATEKPTLKLVDSHAIPHALSIRKNYNYETTMAGVLAEWNEEDQT